MHHLEGGHLELKLVRKRRMVKNQVMEALVEAHKDLQLPQALIKQEITALKGQMVQQFGGAAASLDIDSLLPDDMISDQAERRVRLGLVLNDFISKGEIVADPEKVKETIEGLASTYEDPEEVINYYYGNQQQLQEVQSMVLEETVVDNLLTEATVNDKECSYEDVMTPEAPPEAEEE